MEQTPKFQSPGRYCLRCYYDLRGLPECRCPECGKTFDSQDPTTYSKTPDRERLKNLIRSAKSGLSDAVDSLLPALTQRHLISPGLGGGSPP